MVDYRNIKTRLIIMSLVFLGLSVYYFMIYGLNFYGDNNQYTYIAIIVGLFIALVSVFIKLRRILF
jgi:hypothetical protein